MPLSANNFCAMDEKPEGRKDPHLGERVNKREHSAPKAAQQAQTGRRYTIHRAGSLVTGRRLIEVRKSAAFFTLERFEK